MRALKTYEDWKHCITDICRIPLTPDYVSERLAELRNPKNFHTQRFVDSWGEDHRKRVIEWFEQAEAELAYGATNA